MMKIQIRDLRPAWLVLTLMAGSGFSLAGNHEAHFNPLNPRPDILPRTLYNAWVPYRKEFNRPHPIGGHVAAIIEPSSQEAMAWCLHDANGDYRCHRPGYIPMYNYPKPWEMLTIEPRPNASLVPPLPGDAMPAP
jgi:hypothetical protein